MQKYAKKHIFFCFFHVQLSPRWNAIFRTQPLPVLDFFTWKIDYMGDMKLTMSLSRKFRNCYGVEAWAAKDGDDAVEKNVQEL